MTVHTNLTKEQAELIAEPKLVQFYENVYTVYTDSDLEPTVQADVTAPVAPQGA